MLPRSLNEGYLYTLAYDRITGYAGRIQVYNGELKWEFDNPDSAKWEDVNILWNEWASLWNIGQDAIFSLYIVPVGHISTETVIRMGKDNAGANVDLTFPAGHLSYVAKKCNVWFNPSYVSGEGMFLVFFQPATMNLMGYIESMGGTSEVLKTIPVKDKGVLKQRKRVLNQNNSLSITQLYQNASTGLAALAETPFVARYDIKSGVELEERHLYYGCHGKQSEENFEIGYEYHFVEE